MSGLGSGLRETYAWGSYFTYPPLHLILLGVLALPAIAVGAMHGLEGLRAAPYMTWFEVTSRLVTFAMALGVLANVSRATSRIWDERAGGVAALAIACNPVFVYYAHTGNLEVPALFWATWAMDELVRVELGEARELHAMLLATAAALTKDQAIAMLAIPIAIVIVRRRAWRAIAIAAAAYLIVGGAVVNPVGWVRRVAFLLGPASGEWTPYPPGAIGIAELGRDAALRVVSYGGVLVFVAACVGVVRSRRWLFLSSAVSFTLFFTLAARRSEERFLLPQAVMLAPYVGFALHKRWTIALAFAWPVIESARMDATLAADARNAAHRYLQALPRGTSVETYGFSDAYAVARGDPEVIMMSSRFAEQYARGPTQMDARWASDPMAPYFNGLARDEDPTFHRTERFRCVLPLGVPCRRIHDSTAHEIWVFRRAK